MKFAFHSAFLILFASPTPDPYFQIGERLGEKIAYIALGLFFGIGIIYAIYDGIRKWLARRKS
jgi:hypothetical protein